MTIDVDAVKNWNFPQIRQAYTHKDVILYALALGYGEDPDADEQLRFVYEHDLSVLPTFANTLCHPGFWIADPRTGIDATNAVHGEHRMTFHSGIAPEGCVQGVTRIVDIIDKGRGKGALLVIERRLHDDQSGDLLAVIEQRTLCRADGGFSKAVEGVAPAQVARRDADVPPTQDVRTVDIHVLPQAALMYRLCADKNPLHADPAVARAAGFERPILHGLCTFGIAARAIVAACCNGDPKMLRDIGARFAAPVFPGDTVRVDIWGAPSNLAFRCSVPSRDVAVITQGCASLLT